MSLPDQTLLLANYLNLLQQYNSYKSACHLKKEDEEEDGDESTKKQLKLAKELYGHLPIPWNNSAFPGYLPGATNTLPPSFSLSPSTSSKSPSSYYDPPRSCSPPLNLSKSQPAAPESPAPSDTSTEPEMLPLSLISNTKSGRKKKGKHISPEDEDEWNKRLEERRKINAARERVRNKNMRSAYCRLRSALHLPSSAKHITTLFTALETLAKCTCRSVSEQGSLKTAPMDQSAYLARLNLLMKQAQEQSQHSTRAARRLPVQGPDEEVEKGRRFANAARERKRVKELVNVIRELGRICQAYFDQKGTLGPRTYLDILMMTASIVDSCTCKGIPPEGSTSKYSPSSRSRSPLEMLQDDDSSSQHSRSPYTEQDENKMAFNLDHHDDSEESESDS